MCNTSLCNVCLCILCRIISLGVRDQDNHIELAVQKNILQQSYCYLLENFIWSCNYIDKSLNHIEPMPLTPIK